ncbi:hypothetical protein LOZ61_006243 [Ophidiomyces ophidiicola]|uniref:Uncharacterized protein n=1 Tax=Ophidiomyces ophidiicola TaxID=1387563 RepID=A0ACB8UPM6_9EURO|nr:hypothetical protein LOZ61_006243 [Ophidiomyces ophidiicola]KAI1907505.1 hypothetical protein LOZ64_005867 [Ophidiomyces ophidiicola]KAI1921941.1 hypothetical protein LOZ60_006014 [Ophidiomyces ophidiicola]KAI2000448.1 hypothetical protein LOZ50_005918 [Ophidiomyces ophidiicola]KAI2004324.1 hypothetical protein LOZ49_005903 [Ophidiomyces ophidiicola]
MASNCIQVYSDIQTHDNNPLRLEVSGSARISCPPNSALAPQQPSLGVLNVDDIWLRLSSALLFKLDIQIQDCSEDALFALHILNTISHLLCSAKASCGPIFACPYCWKGQNYNQLSYVESYGKRNANPFLSAAYTHVLPPAGVQVVTVREIEACFNFSMANVNAIKPPARGLQHSLHSIDPSCISNKLFFESMSAGGALSGLDADWVSLDDDSPFSSQEFKSSFSSKDSQITGPDDEQPSNERPRVEIADTYGISQRAALIPIIAKGIHSLLSTTSSLALKSRFAELEKNHQETPRAEENNLSDKLSNTRKVIKYLLWTKMQRKLLSPFPMRKLSPLKLHSSLSTSSQKQSTPAILPSETKGIISAPYCPILNMGEHDDFDCSTDSEDFLADELDELESKLVEEMIGAKNNKFSPTSPTLCSSPMLDEEKYDQDDVFCSDLDHNRIEAPMLDGLPKISSSPMISELSVDSDPILDDDENENNDTDLGDMILDIYSGVDNIDNVPGAGAANEEMLF